MSNQIAEFVSSRGQGADYEFNKPRATRLRPSAVLTYDLMDSDAARQRYVADYLATKLRAAEGLEGHQDGIGALARDWLSTANYGDGITLRALAERFVAEVLDGE